MIPFLTIDTDPENMLVADDPARVFHNSVKQQFSMRDMIVVGAVNPESIYNPSSLQALNQLSQQVLALDGVVRQDLMSLDTVDNIYQEGSGTLRFEWLMKEAPATQSGAVEIRTAVERLPMLNNTVVSGDGKAAAIAVYWSLCTDWNIENQRYFWSITPYSIRNFSPRMDSNSH